MRRAAALFATACTVALACDPQAPDWGLGAIATMKTPPDPPYQCGVIVPQRAPEGCAFAAGARASETLGLAPPVRAALPIRHVVVLMRENRSFDHLFGKLHDSQPGVEPIPDGYTNPGADGRPVSPFHATTTCISVDPGHQSDSMRACIDGGKMDGFVLNAARTTPSDGAFALSYYEPGDLPFYHWLAATFALGDRHFAPVDSGTFASRAFLLFATNAGVVDTGLVFPRPTTPSIFHLLMNAGYTWGAYSDGLYLSGALDWSPGDPGTHSLQDFLNDLDGGRLPNVAFVDGRENEEDDHPVGDLQRGEAWLKGIYDHAVSSPQWKRTALVVTYDEGGGFFDHVPPPAACRPDPSPSSSAQRGVRVPLIVISPWARRGWVSHVVRDHTAITRFIEALFDLPALTARDANADALLDMFDFSCGADQPAPPEPAAGADRCPGGPAPQPD